MIKQRLQNWLGITEPKDYTKLLQEETQKVTRELDFWKGVAKAFSQQPCGYCGKPLFVYPFGGAYYHGEDGNKYHAEGCYDKHLANKPKPPAPKPEKQVVKRTRKKRK